MVKGALRIFRALQGPKDSWPLSTVLEALCDLLPATEEGVAWRPDTLRHDLHVSLADGHWTGRSLCGVALPAILIGKALNSSMLALARSAEEAGGPTFADADFLSEMQAMLPDIASRDDT